MASIVKCDETGRDDSYHHRVVTTFVVLSAVNLFVLAVCAVVFSIG